MYVLFVLDYIEDCVDRILNEDKFCFLICMIKIEIFKIYVEDM